MKLKYAPSAAAGGVFYLILEYMPTVRPVLICLVPIVLPPASAFLAATCLTRRMASTGGYHFGRSLVTDYSVCLPLAFAVGFSLCALSGGIMNVKSGNSSTGLERSLVTGCLVQLIRDPTVLPGQQWAADARLISTSSGSMAADASGPVRLYGRGGIEGLASGRVVRIAGCFRPSQQPPAPVFRVEDWRSVGWTDGYRRIRYSIIARLEETLKNLGDDAAVCFSALILGRRTDPGALLIRNFRNAGCMHLLALSGFHLGLIAVLSLKVFGVCLGYRKSRWTALLLVSMYVCLAGPRPSLIRAWLMFVVYIFASLRHIRLRGVDVLSLAFIVQTIIWPSETRDVGFRLSYAALLGILVSGSALAPMMRRRLPGAFLLASGLSAQGYTMPFVIGVFGVWRPVGIIASLVMTPLLMAVMVCGSVLILTGAAGIHVPDALWNCGNLVVALLGKVAGFFGRFPGVKMTEAASWLIAAGIAIIPLVLKRRLRHEIPDCTEPRLPGLNPVLPGQQGTGSQKALGTEFPHQQGRPGENRQPAGSPSGHPGLGDRSRSRCNE